MEAIEGNLACRLLPLLSGIALLSSLALPLRAGGALDVSSPAAAVSSLPSCSGSRSSTSSQWPERVNQMGRSPARRDE